MTQQTDVTSTPTMQPQTVIHIHADKSPGIAILLTVLLGPLGMFYSTITGAIVMLIVSFLVAIVTFGLGLIITWPICIIWAYVAAKKQVNRSVTQA